MAPSPHQIILAGIDTSAQAEVVVQRAAFLAEKSQATLHLIHVLDIIPAGPIPPPASAEVTQSLFNAARDRLAAMIDLSVSLGVTPFGHLILGSPWREIVQLATDLSADLIVVGTHDPGRIARFVLGSVSDAVVQKASCPVMVIREKRDVHAPEIVPPCPECVAVQRASAGKTLWCPHHTEHHPRAHAWHTRNESYGAGSMTFHPNQ